MPSFFTTFQEKFTKAVKEDRSKGIDLGGRYLALILKEVLTEEPFLAKTFFPEFDMKIKNGRLQTEFSVDTEKSFPGKKQRRAADIEVICGGKSGFIEIKWEDNFLDGQLDDYIEYCSSEGVYFSILYLHPEKFTPAEMDKIRKGFPDGRDISFVSCRDLYKKLTGKNNHVVCLFRDFLKDHIMEYQTEIPRGALLAIMKTGLHWQDGDGLGKIMVADNIDAVPDAWKILLANIKVVGARLYESISAKDRNFTGNRPTVEFSFEPWFDTKVIKKTLDKDNPKRIVADKYESNKVDSSGQLRVHSDGGWFNIDSRTVIKPEDSVLIIGVSFGFWPGEKDRKIHFGAYCHFGKNSVWKTKDSAVKKIPAGDSFTKSLSIPNEDALFDRIVKTTREMLGELESDNPALASPKTIKKLLAALS